MKAGAAITVLIGKTDHPATIISVNMDLEQVTVQYSCNNKVIETVNMQLIFQFLISTVKEHLIVIHV